MGSYRKQVFWVAILSYLTMFLDVFSGLIVTPMIINYLGESKYGLLTLSNSIILIFTLDFGLSHATTTFISNFRARGETEKISSFLGLIYKTFFILDAILFLIFTFLYFNINTIYVNLTLDEQNLFRIIFLFTAIASLISFPCINFNGVLIGYEKVSVVKVSDFIFRIARIILIVVTIFLNLNIFIFFTIYSFSNLIAIAIKYYWIKFKIKLKPDFKNKNSVKIRDIFRFSFWITISMLAQRLVLNITPSILGRYSSTKAIAQFGIASTIEGYVYTFTTVLDGVFMPKISEIYYSKDGKNVSNINPLMNYVGRYNFSINLMIVLVFILIGKDFIYLWIGETFKNSYLATILLIFPAMFYNSMQIAHSTSLIANKPHIIGITDSIMGVTNFILSIFLTKKFGLFGACFAIFFTVFSRAIALHFVYNYALKINMKNFVFNCYIKIIPTVLVVILVGFVLNKYIVNKNWIIFLVKSTIVTLTYLLMVFVTYFTKDEKNKILTIFTKNKK